MESFTQSYLSQVREIAEKIDKRDIDAAIEILFEAWKSDRQIFLAGNGGSASTASHFASDLSKYVSVQGKRRFRSIALTDNVALLTALVNDEGWEEAYSWQLENLMKDGDVLVAISVHGGSGQDNAGLWSQNLMRALSLAKKKGGRVIGLAGFDGGAMKKLADVCVVVPANSTPQVEGFHLVLTHLFAEKLRELVSNAK